MGYAPAGAGSCFAYVFFEAGSWHYTPPIVCPSQTGYNPVMGARRAHRPPLPFFPGHQVAPRMASFPK